MSVGKRLRFEIFKRDRFTCQYCGRRPPDVTLECDHVVAVAEGGSDEPANLTTSCWDCNRGKGAESLGEVMPHLDELERLAAVQEMLERKRDMALQIAVAETLRQGEDDAIGYIEDLWAEVLNSGHFERESVRRFLGLGLSVDDLSRAVHTVAAKGHLRGADRWRYYCGIYWKVLKERKEPLPTDTESL